MAGNAKDGAPLPLETYAALAAEIDVQGDVEQVLGRAEITRETWAAAQAYWLKRMADEAQRKHLATTMRYQTLFAAKRKVFEARSRRDKERSERAAPVPPPVGPLEAAAKQLAVPFTSIPQVVTAPGAPPITKDLPSYQRSARDASVPAARVEVPSFARAVQPAMVPMAPPVQPMPPPPPVSEAVVTPALNVAPPPRKVWSTMMVDMPAAGGDGVPFKPASTTGPPKAPPAPPPPIEPQRKNPKLSSTMIADASEFVAPREATPFRAASSPGMPRAVPPAPPPPAPPPPPPPASTGPALGSTTAPMQPLMELLAKATPPTTAFPIPTPPAQAMEPPRRPVNKMASTMIADEDSVQTSVTPFQPADPAPRTHRMSASGTVPLPPDIDLDDDAPRTKQAEPAALGGAAIPATPFRTPFRKPAPEPAPAPQADDDDDDSPRTKAVDPEAVKAALARATPFRSGSAPTKPESPARTSAFDVSALQPPHAQTQGAGAPFRPANTAPAAKRFTINVFASLTAEIAENPEDIDAIRLRYGLSEAEHHEESQRWTGEFSKNDELRQRYFGIVQRYRGYIVQRRKP